MALLIRHADVITMTERGRFTGDVLIRGSVIDRLGECCIPAAAESVTEIDATGLTLAPGYIDCFVRSGGAAEASLRELALASGVMTALAVPDESGLCMVMDADGVKPSCIRLIEAHRLTLLRLRDALAGCTARGERPLVPIHTKRVLERVLHEAPTGCRLILAGFPAAIDDASLVKEKDTAVIIGHRRGDERLWRMAGMLDEAGVPFAVSCRYPAAKMSLLPVIASRAAGAGISPERAMAAITSGAADLLGMHDRGRIEEGARADLLLLTGDPLLISTERVLSIRSGRIQGEAAYTC